MDNNQTLDATRPAADTPSPIAYVIYKIEAMGQPSVHEVKRITEDDRGRAWKLDDGGLGALWRGNDALVPASLLVENPHGVGANLPGGRTALEHELWCAGVNLDGAREHIDELQATAASLQSLNTQLQQDAARYAKLRRWMSINVDEGWRKIEMLGAIAAYMDMERFDEELDAMPECDVGLYTPPTSVLTPAPAHDGDLIDEQKFRATLSDSEKLYQAYERDPLAHATGQSFDAWKKAQENRLQSAASPENDTSRDEAPPKPRIIAFLEQLDVRLKAAGYTHAQCLKIIQILMSSKVEYLSVPAAMADQAEQGA